LPTESERKGEKAKNASGSVFQSLFEKLEGFSGILSRDEQ
jgi:hypothetical protein